MNSRIVLHILSEPFPSHTTPGGIKPLIAAGILDLDTDEFHFFLPNHAHQITPIITNAKLLVTYNGEYSAYRILRKYYGLRGLSSKVPLNGDHVQIQKAIGHYSNGSSVKFESAILANLPSAAVRKRNFSDMTEAALREACLSDVQQLKQLYDLYLLNKLSLPKPVARNSKARNSSNPSTVSFQLGHIESLPSNKLHPLEFELVPKTAWFSNVRSMVSKRDWDLLRNECYQLANHCCEVCGGHGKKHRVEAHEVWNYDDEIKTQTLVRLIALCPSCHSVKHIGNAFQRGVGDESMEHYMKVNNFSVEDAKERLLAAFEMWDKRSQHQWQCNISWLDRKGVSYKAERQKSHE